MRTRSTITLLMLATLAACGSDATDPEDGGNGDGDGNGTGTVSFTAELDADNIVGATIESSATGSATFEFDSATGNLAYTVNVQNMDNVINAHIHAAGTPSQNAPIRLTLFSTGTPTGTINGQLVSGTVAPGTNQLETSMTLAQVVTHMLNNMAHVMVHSSEHPDGEIRGHVIPEP